MSLPRRHTLKAAGAFAACACFPGTAKASPALLLTRVLLGRAIMGAAARGLAGRAIAGGVARRAAMGAGMRAGSVRAAAAIPPGMTQLPDIGLVIDGIIAVTDYHAATIRDQGVSSLWINEEPNRLSVEGQNLYDFTVHGTMSAEIIDPESGQAFDADIGTVIFAPGSRFQTAPVKIHAPGMTPGIKIASAYMRGLPLVTAKETVLVVDPSEVFRG